MTGRFEVFWRIKGRFFEMVEESLRDISGEKKSSIEMVGYLNG